MMIGSLGRIILASSQRYQKALDNHHVSWENSLFLQSCSIAVLNFRRVPMVYLLAISMVYLWYRLPEFDSYHVQVYVFLLLLEVLMIQDDPRRSLSHSSRGIFPVDPVVRIVWQFLGKPQENGDKPQEKAQVYHQPVMIHILMCLVLIVLSSHVLVFIYDTFRCPSLLSIFTGRWFGTVFIFPYIWNHHHN